MACCAGEPITLCYREDSRFKGRCPVADDAPELDEDNDIAVDIFFDLLRTAQTLEGEKKTIWYMKAIEFSALCDVYDIVEDEKLSIWSKVKLLETVWNETRPSRPKPKGAKRKGRR